MVQKNGIPVILGGFPEKIDEGILPKIGKVYYLLNFFSDRLVR